MPTEPHPHAATPSGLPRARSLGIALYGKPGPWNAITDVPGVEVGYRTLISGSSVRTGVTGIHPRGKAGALDPVAAGFSALNGNGELTGVSWINESGTFAGPVAITSTASIGAAHAGVTAWAARTFPSAQDAWLLPVAAETYDGYLNDMYGMHVTESDVVLALDSAASGPVDEGSVGGGTGMNCYAFKGGSGTSSRVVGPHTVGVFVQANFGRRDELVIAGFPAGRSLLDDNPIAEYNLMQAGAGSVIAIVATDAPLLPGQCAALARRVPLGLARTGTTGSHYSGDLFLAFSVANPGAFDSGRDAVPRSLEFLPWGAMDPYFGAVVQATEEAVLNSLVANREMTGRDGHRSPALPLDRVRALLGI